MGRGAGRTLSALGEFELIDRIDRFVRAVGRANRGGGTAARALRVGIGDDAAVLTMRRGEEFVVSSDAFVEEVHFRWETRSPASIGRCALAASLSDLAAMGARPLGFTCAFAAPPALPLERFDGLFRGLIAAAAEWGSPLVGGNVTRAKQTSLALTVFGAVSTGRALLRSNLRAGDRLFVTGTLGGAALALARTRAGRKLRHVPEPRLAAGRALARMRQRVSCIDVSDGLLADLHHLLDSSGNIGAQIDVRALPRPRGFDVACAREGLDADRLVLAGGEDYELLFSLAERAPSEAVLSRRMGVTVTEIGRASERSGIQGVATALLASGWKHF